MYLEKLTIQGFKSFAHEVELVFTRKLTAIVGPNGSGKSNTADAIRWVLGEQSPKLLRGKKAEDVIFSGSEKRSRLSFAQVDLHLDNTSGQAPVDYKKIVISRKIYRSGESEYLLNNNKVRLTDIQLLLAKSHFGQKTYSVIGQGTIDRMLTFTASERKDFFDEATGVKQYQIKKDQAVHKLHQTFENLTQAEQVLNEITPRLRSLKRQVNRLEAKEKLEGELRELQTEYYSFLTSNLDKDLSEIRDNESKEQTKLDKLNSQLAEIQNKLEGQGAEVSRSEGFDLLQKKLTALQDEYNVLSREKTRLEGARDVDLMKSGQSDLVWLQSRLDSLNAKENKLKVDLEENQHNLKGLETKISDFDKKVKSLNHDIDNAEKSWQQQLEPQANWQELEKQAASIKDEQQKLDSELQKITSLEDVSSFKEKLSSFGKKLKDFLNLIKRPPEQTSQDSLTNLKKLLADKDSATEKLQEFRINLEIAKKGVDTLEEQIKDINSEKSKLAEEMESAGGKTKGSSNLDQINKELNSKAKEIENLNQEINDFNKKEEGKKQQILDWQKEYSRLQYDHSLVSNQMNKLNIEKARLETKEEDLKTEITDEFPSFKVGKVHNIHPDSHKNKIQDIKRQLSIIGGIDEDTLKEYNEVKERADFLEQQSKDLNEAMASLKKLIKELDETISKEFNTSFKKINEYFGKYFKKLFNGGTAKLVLQMQEPKEEEELDGEEKELEEETDGKLKFESLNYTVDIVATPPGKKLSGINMLSGGEKALTAIALISAIIANNPSPFVVLDEVDAALDEANSIRFADIVDELSDKTQFITITHNRATMHQAKILYGVTMGDDGVSNLLSVNFEEADKIAA